MVPSSPCSLRANTSPPSPSSPTASPAAQPPSRSLSRSPQPPPSRQARRTTEGAADRAADQLIREGARDTPQNSQLNAGPFRSHDDAFAALQSFAAKPGFAIVRKRTIKSRAVGLQAEAIRVDIQCSRTAVSKSKSIGRRGKGAKGTGCKFRAVITRETSKTEMGTIYLDRWHVKIQRPTHNHDLDPTQREGDATSRRAQRLAHGNKVELAIERLSSITTMTSRQIAHYLSGKLASFDDTEGGQFATGGDNQELERLRRSRLDISAQDVRNIQRRLCLSKYGPFTSTKRFIDLLEQYKTLHGIEYFVDWIVEDGGERRPRRVFWTYKWCLEMWKNNPEVLLMDNTYKVGACVFLPLISSVPAAELTHTQVNRFNMPLLNIVGVNGLHKNFSVAFALSLQETEDDFHWQLACLKRLQESYSVDAPGVIISDFCRGFKKAALAVYPTVPQQLCVWHVMKNVVHHVSKKWVQLGDSQPLLTAIPTALGTLDGPGPDPPSYRPLIEDEAAEEGDGEDPEEALDEAVASDLTQRQDSTPVDIPVRRQGANPGNNLDNPGNQRRRFYEDSRDGFVKAWVKVVYADEEDVYQRAWDLLCAEFPSQSGKF
jgi:hypothetical protein